MSNEAITNPVLSGLRYLANARVNAQQAQAEAEEAQAILAESDPWIKAQEAAQLYRDAKALVAKLEEQLKTDTLNYYHETGDKQPVKGVIDIKLFKKPYWNNEILIPWLEEQAPGLIVKSVDPEFKKQIDSWQRKGAPVTIEYIPGVAIKQDLSGYQSDDLGTAPPEADPLVAIVIEQQSGEIAVQLDNEDPGIE